MRFQEHIICLVEIPEQLYEYYIPKLMIQPLLENAIVHGVSELKETGMIAVTGKETEDAIYITVKITEWDAGNYYQTVGRNKRKWNTEREGTHWYL